jgi:chemotaxis protein MotB
LARRNRRRREIPENHDRWLITYADLITLLMIFFVVLYAMSRIDVAKYEALSQSLQFEFSAADIPLEMGTGVGGALDPAQQPKPVKTEDDKKAAEAQRKKAQEKELQDLLKVVIAYIKENHLESQIIAADTPKGILIRLSDLFLFDLGKADLKEDAVPVLNRLAALFSSLNTTISIEGHTDNLPMQAGGAFQDNWGLSSARSLSVVRYFVDTAKLDPKTFESAAYADTRPVVPNTNEANRQKNRRVEITVLRKSESP